MQDSRSLRYVDRYVGKAACGVLSYLRAVGRIGRKSRTSVSEPPRRILLVELFEMGASVMISPSISYLKKMNPQAEIHCLVSRTCLPVWKAIGQLDEDKIHVIESGSPVKFLFSALRVLRGLRKTPFDLIVDYELFMRISALFVGVLRAKRRAGFYRYNFEGLQRGEFYETRCAYNQNAHISRNYLALTQAAFERRDMQPNFKGTIPLEEISIRPTIARASPREIEHLLGTQDPYFIVCPDVGKTLAVRNYPPASIAAVTRELLLLYPKRRAVLIGTAENAATSKAILNMLNGDKSGGQNDLRSRCLDLCGKTSFDDLLKVISAADLLITNDNGPGHFATLTGTKTLALFSTDSPFVYGPLGDAVIAYSFYQCSPCISAYNHKTSACDNNLCLQALPQSLVTELAASILEGKAKFRTINGKIPYLF